MSATPKYVIPSPTVYLGGTSREALIAQYRDAILALTAAVDALPVPHGRDYSIGGGQQAHLAACAAVTAMTQDLGAMMRALGVVLLTLDEGAS